LLNTGEDVVVDLRPHWWFFAGPAAMLLVSIFALVFAMSKEGTAAKDARLVLACITLASLVWFAGRYLRWATTNFAVTTDRIIFRHGVIAKRGIEIPLERVNTIFFRQSIWERVIGTGDLIIESAGERGSEPFSDIRRPSFVQNEIYRLMEEAQAQTAGGGHREQSIPDQIERLDELRRRSVITEAEFQAKKAQLLDRM